MTKPLSPRPMRSPVDAGVYVIESGLGKVYVGATSCRLGMRLAAHRSALRCGHHTNRGMQRDWDATGGEGFTFEVLERVGPEERESLGAREAYWMERLGAHDTATGYNQQPPGMSLGPRPAASAVSVAQLAEAISRRLLA